MNGTIQKKTRATKTSSPVREREPLYPPNNKSKFEVYGEEMIEKEVKQSGNSGRVYLPPEWVGRHVKIIRID
jgi:putative transposon-encoded protein